MLRAAGWLAAASLALAWSSASWSQCIRVVEDRELPHEIDTPLDAALIGAAAESGQR
jgi:hypothetical protein